MGLRSLLVLHRRMGLVSALFVLLLSATGLLLHHSNSLGLDRASVSSAVLLQWYGIEQPAIDRAFAAADATVLQIDRALYFNSQPLAGEYATLQGMVEAPFGFIIATASRLVLLTTTGDVIEILGPEHGVPQPVTGLGTSQGDILLRTNSGAYSADVDALSFAELEPQSPNWVQPIVPAVDLAATVARHYAQSLVSWERVLLDLHSGQILGPIGRLLVDVMALVFILMAITGVWIWSRRRV
jgi:hypothetical protein